MIKTIVKLTTIAALTLSTPAIASDGLSRGNQRLIIHRIAECGAATQLALKAIDPSTTKQSQMALFLLFKSQGLCANAATMLRIYDIGGKDHPCRVVVDGYIKLNAIFERWTDGKITQEEAGALATAQNSKLGRAKDCTNALGRKAPKRSMRNSV